jgi:hypothetical protein
MKTTVKSLITRVWQQYLINALFKALSKLLLSPFLLAYIRSNYNALLTMTTKGTGLFPWIKRPGRGVATHPYLAPMLKKEYSCTSTLPLDIRGLFYDKFYFKYLQSKLRSTCKNISFLLQLLRMKVKVKQSRYRPGVAHRVPGS